MIHPNQLIEDIFGIKDSLIMKGRKNNHFLKKTNPENTYFIVLYDKNKIVYIGKENKLNLKKTTWDRGEIYHTGMKLLDDCIESLLVNYYKPHHNTH